MRGIMADKNANAVAVRKIGKNLRESVYEQCLWAIDKLGAADLWDSRVSIPELVYRPTGQRIIFKGADDPRKFKSVKVSQGYVKFIWFEEADEFAGISEIDMINQSLMRGNGGFVCIYTYNPPRSAAAWINSEFAKKRTDRLLHKSDYRGVPENWLGRAFLAEAEYLKERDKKRYLNEYLGEMTGTGAEVFPNVVLREITDDEVKRFDRIYRGIDWGYGADPFVYIGTALEKGGRELYIFEEFYGFGASFDEIAENIGRMTARDGIITAGKGIHDTRGKKGAGVGGIRHTQALRAGKHRHRPGKVSERSSGICGLLADTGRKRRISGWFPG